MCNQLGRGEILAGLGQVVPALLAALPLGGSGVHCEHEVLAGLVACLLNSAEDILDSLLVACEIRSEAALVADGGRKPLALEQRSQCVEHLGAPAQTLGEALCADRHYHEFLNVHGVRSVRAAVENVHHRNRKSVRVNAAEETVQRNVEGGRCGSCAGDGDRQNSISAELALVLCAVCFDHCLVNGVDIGSVHADDSFADNGVYVVHSPGNALAAESGLVAVAKFQRLKLACGSAAGSRAARDGAVCEPYFSFNGRVSAGIDDLAPDDIFDLKIVHVVYLSFTYPLCGVFCIIIPFYGGTIHRAAAVLRTSPTAPNDLFSCG